MFYKMPNERTLLKYWADRVKSRDKHQCIICPRRERLNAHHLIPKEIKFDNTHLKLWNGVTLCPKHHRFSRSISAHQHPIAFQMWMEENRNEQLEVVKDAIRRMAEEISTY